MKKTLLIMVAVIFSIGGVVIPVAAQVYASDEARIQDEWRRDLREWHRSEKERSRLLDERERRIKEMEQQQQYAAPIPPPAGEFVSAPAPEAGLVPRTFYYPDPYYGGCIVFSGLFPLGWSYPGWYSYAPYGWPIIGRVRTNFVNNTVAINNVQALSPRIDNRALNRHVRENFNASRKNAGAMQPRQQIHPRGNLPVVRPQVAPRAHVPTMPVPQHRPNPAPVQQHAQGNWRQR